MSADAKNQLALLLEQKKKLFEEIKEAREKARGLPENGQKIEYLMQVIRKKTLAAGWKYAGEIYIWKWIAGTFHKNNRATFVPDNGRAKWRNYKSGKNITIPFHLRPKLPNNGWRPIEQ